MKIGIIQTAPNNCAALDKIAARYPGLDIVHYVDGCPGRTSRRRVMWLTTR
ncbi:hypothetical protein [Acutalibacter sp. 1XD8-33]|uniref:hypothetical protein n=1 Tax=Acutalibacter sp. 1XD8-33 TaxID=2320081 RepID=UPI0013142935|nr:hypothetical protein [Acutalibacter sp. 1XD8-33]